MIYNKKEMMALMNLEKELNVSLKREAERLIPPARLEQEIRRQLLSVAQEEPLGDTWSPVPTASVQDLVCYCYLQTVHCPIV